MASDSTSSEYSIVLTDETSKPAQSAGQALARLGQQIEADQKKLRAMQAAMARLKGGTVTNVAAFRALRDQISAQRARVASAQSAYVDLGGTFGETQEQAGGFLGGLRGLLEAAKRTPGPVGQLATRIGALASPMTLAIGLAAALALGLVAVATAAIAGAVSLGRLALASADARRSELLHLEGLTTLRNAYGVTAGRASDLVAAIDRVSDSSALSRSEIGGMAESLYRAGLRGANLSDALEGLSIAQSVQGDRGAARFRAMAVSIARTGGSVRRLSDDVRARLGGIAARQALGFGRQLERLQESVARIFADVRIEGFLQALHSVVSLFSQSTETGRALHTLVGVIFSPLFDQIGVGAPLVRRFFQGVVIASQRVTIIVLRVRNALRRTFGESSIFAIFDGGRASLIAGAAALTVLAVAALAVAAPFLLLGAAFVGGYMAVQKFRAGLTVLAIELLNLRAEWSNAGDQMIEGLLGGLQRGYDRVRGAVRGLAAAATTALTDALEIRSPSRVFAGFGLQIPRGLAEGVERGAREAEGAVEGLGGGTADAAPSGGGRLGRGAPITFGDVHVTLQNGTRAEAQEAARAFVEQVASMLEGVAVELGAPT